MPDKKFPFPAPVGPSEYHWEYAKFDGPVTCGGCGTEFPKGNSYAVCRFLGKDIVKDCCGKVLDIIYAESGEDIFRRQFEDFIKNPFAGEYGSIRFLIADSESDIADKIKQAVEYSKVLLNLSDAAKAINFIKSLDPKNKL